MNIKQIEYLTLYEVYLRYKYSEAKENGCVKLVLLEINLEIEFAKILRPVFEIINDIHIKYPYRKIL